MHLHAAFGVFVALNLFTAGKGQFDPDNALTMKNLNVCEPDQVPDPNGPLWLRCSVDVTKAGFERLTSLKLFKADDGLNFEKLATLTEKDKCSSSSVPEVTAGGRYQTSMDYRSKLEVHWTTKDEGLNTHYRCEARGTLPVTGEERKIIKDGHLDSLDCKKR